MQATSTAERPAIPAEGRLNAQTADYKMQLAAEANSGAMMTIATFLQLCWSQPVEQLVA